jgi:hypothetical protein
MAYILPAISNFILVLMGVLLSLPALAERIEKTPKYRIILAVVCLVLGSIGFLYDVIQRRSNDTDMRELISKTRQLVTKEDTLVTNTSQSATSLGVLLTEVTSIDARMAALGVKIDEARGNPRLIAELKADAAALQKQSETVSRKGLATLDGLPSNLLVAMANLVTSKLRTFFTEWWSVDYKLRGSKYFETEHHPSERNPAVLEQRKLDWDNKIKLEREEHRSELQQILLGADQLRKILLGRLPKDAQTSEDIAEAAVFAQALSDATSISPTEFGCPPGIIKVADYLDALANRILGSKGANQEGQGPSPVHGIP